MGFRIRKMCAYTLAVAFTGHMVWDKFLRLSDSQSPHVSTMGVIMPAPTEILLGLQSKKKIEYIL